MPCNPWRTPLQDSTEPAPCRANRSIVPWYSRPPATQPRTDPAPRIPLMPTPVRAPRGLLLAAVLVVFPAQILAQPALTSRRVNRNRPERVEWFRNAGFGLFIHWSVDVQLGTVISHSLVGASDEYLRRY